MNEGEGTVSYANVLPAVAQGTHTTAGEGLILDVGEYVEGKLWVLTLARTSTTRLYPLYQESPDAGAHWLTVKSAATAPDCVKTQCTGRL